MPTNDPQKQKYYYELAKAKGYYKRPEVKAAMYAASKRWKAKNREHVNEYFRNYARNRRDTGAEHQAAKERGYYDRPGVRERLAAACKRWRKKNKEHCSEYGRAYNAGKRVHAPKPRKPGAAPQPKRRQKPQMVSFKPLQTRTKEQVVIANAKAGAVVGKWLKSQATEKAAKKKGGK